MTAQLYIAAKRPVPGRVKTRLAAAIGDAAAAALYRAFLADLGSRFPDCVWYVTPAGWTPGGATLTQPTGDWTDRQRRLFRRATRHVQDRLVLIASDSPQVGAEVVAEAFGLLDRHDLVVGPVLDGGYYLIGMRGWHDVLAGVTMSTSSVFRDVVEGARARGLSVATVEPTYDVDELSDLALLELDAETRDDLPATRAALAALRAGALA